MKKIFRNLNRNLKAFMKREEKPQNFVTFLRKSGKTLDAKMCLSILREIFLINKGRAHANGYFSYFENRFNLFDLAKYPELNRDYKRLIGSASVILEEELSRKHNNGDNAYVPRYQETPLMKAITAETSHRVTGIEKIGWGYSFTGGEEC